MKKILVVLLLLVLMTTACRLTPAATPPPTLPPVVVIPTTAATPAAVEPTPTPEIFIARTQAIPAHVSLGGTTLAVLDASLGACSLPECPPAPAGTRYMRVSLQALDLPAGQSLDYKNLPDGIAVNDDTGASTAFTRLLAYTPGTQQISLYFTVPETAAVFGLQWPGSAEIPLTVTASSITIDPTQALEDTPLTFAPLSLVLPASVASGASSDWQVRVDSPDAAWWMKTPGHLQVSLNDYYILKGKSTTAQIRVYPAVEYAQLAPAAFESLHRLNNYLYDPDAPAAKEQLPAVPFYDSVQILAAHVQELSFENGRGVRMVTQYSDGLVPANNLDLFYHYEGFTNDGQYYVVATLPVRATILQEDHQPGSAVPEGGVPMPDLSSPNLDLRGYYASVQQALDEIGEGDFTPSLEQLDRLIQSMTIAP